MTYVTRATIAIAMNIVIQF